MAKKDRFCKKCGKPTYSHYCVEHSRNSPIGKYTNVYRWRKRLKAGET